MIPAAKTNHRICYLLIFAVYSIYLFSCTTVKNYPSRKPFVYETNISIEGKFKKDEKKQLISQLNQQLDDSIAVHKQQKLIFWETLKNPPVYDSVNADKSVLYMRALLNSIGYFRDSINYKVSVDSTGDQYRATVDFKVNPGKLIHIDSLSYHLGDSNQKSHKLDTLQIVTNQSLGQALIKKGDPFSQQLISSELDRLSDVYRNNGYLLFTKNELVAVWDTLGQSLLRPTLDPIEQAQQLEALRKRRENPTADVDIRLRPNNDSSHFTRYYVGTVRIFPDFTGDTTSYEPVIDTLTRYRMQFVSYQGLFTPRKLIHFITLRRGDLYKQTNLLQTQNKFNTIGSWRMVNISQLPRRNQDTVDFDIRLTPARKYAFSANLEGSKNQSANILEGSYLGLGVNFGLNNRNFARAASQATTNFRYGIELNSSEPRSFIQTNQISLTHTITFPRLVPRFPRLLPVLRENARTFLTFNISDVDRVDYFKVIGTTVSYGYETSWKNKLFNIRFPNIEYNLLEKRDSLNKLIKNNASYKYIFNDGLILSTLLNFRVASGKGRSTTNLLNISLEPSGLVAGTFKSAFFDSNLYRFIKLDAEFVQTIKMNSRNTFAWRVFAGAGYELPSKTNRNNQYLPFFRQYYDGGANSMRAWAVRRLGPGSALKSFDQNIAPDRFGDMRLELNGEYRFYLTQFFGFPLESALYTDIGNVWFLRANPDFIDGEFKLNRLWKDIAIGTGTGLRIDFGFLKLRLDYAYKVKNPTPDVSESNSQNQWFYNWKPFNGQFQLGIGYPF